MKANEFFKKFGIVKASKAVIGHPKAAVYKFYNYDFEEDDGKHDEVCLADLKRLVESHELVEWHGGMKYAKSYFERNSKEYPNAKGWDKLAEAIADVESCME